jgi:WXG100 family type VII secretion target
MAGGTSIDDATLHAAARDCRSASESVNAEAGKVRGAKESVAARWRGGASNTFQNVIDAWLGDTNKLLEALGGISDLLDKTGTAHRANEDQQDQMFGRFNSAINR